MKLNVRITIFVKRTTILVAACLEAAGWTGADRDDTSMGRTISADT